MRQSKKKWFSKGIILIIVFILIGSIWYFFREKLDVINIIMTSDEIAEPETSIKVSIVNGCGFPGIATEVKEKLIKKGKIDVIAWKNNTRNMFIYKQTIIIAKQDNPEKLAYLQHLTGIPFRAYSFNPNSIEEYYIILGHDYEKYFK
jgi:hypothetical protein